MLASSATVYDNNNVNSSSSNSCSSSNVTAPAIDESSIDQDTANDTTTDGTKNIPATTDATTNPCTDPILLFARLPGEPYLCLGRVCVLSHNFTHTPLVLHLRLCHYDKLTTGHCKHQFERVLSASPMT